MNLMKMHKAKAGFGGAVQLTAVLVTVLYLMTGGRADAEATKVTILKSDGKRETGFIQDSNDKAILFSFTPDVRGQAVSRSGIKSIYYQEQSSIMGRGHQAFAAGAYDAAAQIFGKIATDYEGISALENNFACVARFYQMESLRRLGKYDELAALLDTRSGKAITATQDRQYGEQVQLLKMWAAYSGSKWDEVKAGLKLYEVPKVGDAKLLPVPVFKKMSKATMVQLSYIRGKMYEQEKKMENAQEDYYRAFTITYGNQRNLAKEAMLAAMAIEAANPKLKDLKSKKWQLEGLSYYYKNGVGEGEIPAEYSQYAVLPDIPVSPIAAKQKEEGEGDAKAAEEVEGDKKGDAGKKKAEGGKKAKKAEDKKGATEEKAEEKKAK